MNLRKKLNPVSKENKRVKQVDKAEKLIEENETKLLKQLEKWKRSVYYEISKMFYLEKW